MRDLPHHIKKLNRRVVRSAHREELEEEGWASLNPSPYARKQTPNQLKKQAKIKRAQASQARAPTPLTPEEKNRQMKQRVPVFDRLNNAKPKQGARKTAKKTPRI